MDFLSNKADYCILLVGLVSVQTKCRSTRLSWKQYAVKATQSFWTIITYIFGKLQLVHMQHLCRSVSESEEHLLWSWMYTPRYHSCPAPRSLICLFFLTSSLDTSLQVKHLGLLTYKVDVGNGWLYKHHVDWLHSQRLQLMQSWFRDWSRCWYFIGSWISCDQGLLELLDPSTYN